MGGLEDKWGNSTP